MENNLEKRADSAAERLKASMGLPTSKVSDQGYANQEPPEGSYAAQALQQQREAANNRPAQQAVEEASAEAPPPVAPQQAEETELSPRANERIADLARQRREYEQRAEIAEAEHQKVAKDNQRLVEEFQRLQAQYQQVLESNLENLDPEDRARVMAEANARQVAESVEQRILAKMQPLMEAIEGKNFQTELQDLAQRYPAFDPDIHIGRIAAVKKSAPALSVDQAFRAIATNEELRESAGPQVPSVVAPRGTRGTAHIAEPPQKDPDEALFEERDQWLALSRSPNPSDKKRADQLLQQHLKHRLFGASGG